MPTTAWSAPPTRWRGRPQIRGLRAAREALTTAQQLRRRLLRLDRRDIEARSSSPTATSPAPGGARCCTRLKLAAPRGDPAPLPRAPRPGAADGDEPRHPPPDRARRVAEIELLGRSLRLQARGRASGSRSGRQWSAPPRRPPSSCLEREDQGLSRRARVVEITGLRAVGGSGPPRPRAARRPCCRRCCR